MLKRMVGCAFSSGNAGRASGSGSTFGATAAGSGQSAPSQASAEPRRASSGTTGVASSASSSPAPAPTAWVSRSATREELEARRIAERKFITSHDSTETDVWYIIDVEWLSEWKRFVLRNGPLPGPIRNETLVDARNGNKPRLGLELVTHYRGVNAEIWRYWVARYGGGPCIRRQKLELYSAPARESTLYAAPDVPSEDDPLDLPQHLLTGAGTVDASEASNSFAAAERAEDSATPSKASSRRSFSFFKGYRGGGKASRSSASNAKAARSSKESKSPEANADNSSSTGEIPGMHWLVKESEACVVAQPMDGSCLFHSLSYGIDDGSDATALRLDISNYIAGNPDMVIAGTALKDWIKFDSGGKVAAYAAEMAGGTWGGGIEIEAFVKLKGVTVHVYEACPGGYRRIARFEAGSESSDRNVVTLLYQGREHYDSLVLNDAAGRWVPRTGMAFHAGA